MSLEKSLALLAQELRVYVDNKDDLLEGRVKSTQEKLSELYELLKSIPAGPAGQDADPQTVANLLTHDADFMSAVRGEDGVSIKSFKVSDTGDLSVVLSNDEEYALGNFVGQKGDQGDMGPEGPQGEPGVNAEVDYDLVFNEIKALIADEEFRNQHLTSDKELISLWKRR